MDVLATPFGIEAQARQADAQLVGDLSHLAQMFVNLLAGLMQGFQRRARQFHLPARLQGDRPAAFVKQGDHVSLLEHRRPPENLETFQKRLDSPRPFVGQGAEAALLEGEFFMLGADAPVRLGLAARFQP